MGSGDPKRQSLSPKLGGVPWTTDTSGRRYENNHLEYGHSEVVGHYVGSPLPRGFMKPTSISQQESGPSRSPSEQASD